VVPAPDSVATPSGSPVPTDFYEQMHAVEPYFQSDGLPDGDLEEQHQSRESREKTEKAARCIWCVACISSCNIVQGNQYHLGSVPIVKSYRFYTDEREAKRRGAGGSTFCLRSAASGGV